MAATRLINLSTALLCGCLAMSPVARGAQSLAQSKEKIELTAENTEVDFKTGKAIWHHVTISQGEVSIRADRAEATGVDFNDSRWEFTGKVHIVAESRGTLQSDKAIVEFLDNRIRRATVTGNPAQFEQKRDGTTDAARGRANEIVYEVDSGTVRFTRNAWLSNSMNEISGSVLVYNIRQQKVEGTTSPDGQQRVQITITPKDSGKVVVKPQPPAQPEGSSKP